MHVWLGFGLNNVCACGDLTAAIEWKQRAAVRIESNGYYFLFLRICFIFLIWCITKMFVRSFPFHFPCEERETEPDV